MVFPYHSKKGRYHLNFFGARLACQDQGASLATPEQLHTAWEEGLDWCNAGWLADGSVRYPVTGPRDGCGGGAPGLRSYGERHRLLDQFDAFCFSASIKGRCERKDPNMGPTSLGGTRIQAALCFNCLILRLFQEESIS